MKLKLDQAISLLQNARELDDAQIMAAQAGDVAPIRVITIPLDTAQTPSDPKVIKFPFKGLVVLSATDSNVSINGRLDTLDSSNDSFPLKSPGGIFSERPFSAIYLDWSAQAGKTITLLLSMYGQIQTNQIGLAFSGGVNVKDGDSISVASVTLTAATASQIVAVDTTRKKIEFENETGDDIWLGPSNVSNASTTKGRVLRPGANFVYTNTAALYGYSVGGGTLTYLKHS
jgi:hypothetical protein